MTNIESSNSTTSKILINHREYDVSSIPLLSSRRVAGTVGGVNFDPSAKRVIHPRIYKLFSLIRKKNPDREFSEDYIYCFHHRVMLEISAKEIKRFQVVKRALIYSELVHEGPDYFYVWGYFLSSPEWLSFFEKVWEDNNGKV